MSFTRRFVLAVAGLTATAVVAASGAYARDFFVDGTQGTNRAECLSAPGVGAAACRTIGYVINGVNLSSGGPNTINVASGTYRESISFGSSDSGTSAARVTLRGAGPGQTAIVGLDASPLDDATAVQCTAATDCAGNGTAYPNTYRFNIAGRPNPLSVVETKWTPILVDDGAVTGVVFELTKPAVYAARSSVASVNSLSGSYWVSGSNLYVHTFQDVRPSTAVNDIEMITANAVVSIDTANYVTIEGVRVAYGKQALIDVVESGFTVLRDIVAHSVEGQGIWFHGGSSDGTLEDIDVSHAYGRNEFTTANGGSCSTATCGWYNNGGGTGLAISADDGPGRFVVRRVTAYSSWNVVQVGHIKDSVFEDLLAKNSPNHTFIMRGTNSNSGTDAGDCTGNRLIRVMAFNGQDGFFIRGCTNGKMIRCMGDVSFFDQVSGTDGDSHGWTVLSSMLNASDPGASNGISVASRSHAGFKANNNWHNTDRDACSWSGRVDCRTTWPSQCSCDQAANYGAPLLTNAAWPIALGLAASRYTRADLAPRVGSSTIDAGSRDLDGDGNLETGPGGDDECTAAHLCSGSGPDIGPFEWGLGGTGGSAPPPPNNVRRIDQ